MATTVNQPLNAEVNGGNRTPTRIRGRHAALRECILYKQLVYVIGLHAVQFENSWMRKIPRTAKLDKAVG